MKLLTLLLIVTFLVEIIGSYYTRAKESSFFLYYGYTFFQYIVIYFLYKNLIRDKKWLRVPEGLMVIFVITWLFVFYFKNLFYYLVIIGSFNVGVLVFLYLRELLLSDEIINYKRLLPFWVSVGFLVFHLPAIPFFSFWTYMKNRDLLPILHSLIVLMNIIMSFGLLWSNRKEEY